MRGTVRGTQRRAELIVTYAREADWDAAYLVSLSDDLWAAVCEESGVGTYDIAACLGAVDHLFAEETGSHAI